MKSYALFFFIAIAGAAAASGPDVRVESTAGAIRLSVRDGASWRPILQSAPATGNPSLIETTAMRPRITAAPGRVRVVSTVRLSRPTPVEAIRAQWRFLPGRPDFTWTPNLMPNPDEVVGQHVFRSPAIVVQKGRLSAVLLPDLDVLDREWRTLPGTLHLDANAPGGPRLTYALQDHEVVRHVYWRHQPGSRKTIGPGTVTLAYDILLSANTPPRMAYRAAAHWWWQRQGERNLRDTLPQAVPWADYARVGYDRYLPLIWNETTMDGDRVGGASMNVLVGMGATWFQCWFNDLRTAYGTYLWGQWLNRPDLVEKARLTRALLLHAPQTDGLFPVIYDWRQQRWLRSSEGGVGGGPDIFHSVDCAWAAYWLLMWHRDLEKSPESVAFARRLGDFFVTAQLPSGEVPAYYVERDGVLVPNDRLVHGAETAGCGMFLALLYRETHDARYLAAARKAAAYIRRDVWPRNRWYDYETFYSCSRKPETFTDPISDQNPQNNLSIHWSAELFRQLYLAERQPRDLADGEAMMDYLNLYQQAWAPSFLTFEGFGGYGVQNTDAEWNDARQAQFACTNLDFYALTKKPEYLERGIAAMRAGFATTYMPENAYISPRTYAKTPTGHADENYGHGGTDAPAGPTSWDWGTGSALAAVAYGRRAYGDVWVDWNARKAFGINGVTATLKGSDLRVESSIQRTAPVIVKGTGPAPARVTVNAVARRTPKAAWASGFQVSPVARPRLRHRPPSAISADHARIALDVWPRSAGSKRLTATYAVVRNGKVAKRGQATLSPTRDGRQALSLPESAFAPGAQRLRYTLAGGRTFETTVVRFGDESPLWSTRFGADAEGWENETPAEGAAIEPVPAGLRITLPGTRPYDQWTDANNAPRLLHAVPDGDWAFAVAMPLAGLPGGGNFQAGLMVQCGPNDYAFYGPFGGRTVTLERTGRNGLATASLPPGAPSVELRARRVGGTVWFDWRAGGAWSEPAPMPVASAPSRAGVFVKTWEPIAVEAAFTSARMGRLAP